MIDGVPFFPVCGLMRWGQALDTVLPELLLWEVVETATDVKRRRRL
jgi:hypothetical protein